MVEIETWKDVPGYEGFYEASNLGRVRSLDRETVSYRSQADRYVKARFKGKLLEPCVDWRGKYMRVCLKLPGERAKAIELNRIIALTFCGKPGRNNFQAAHRDGNPKNNRADNLYWATPLENAADAIRHGGYKRGEKHAGAKLTDSDVRRIRASALPYKWLALDYGVSIVLIQKIRSGVQRRCA